ncbi:hypothetical protein GCM10018962_56980 [Dactylosporangium matsuzakiense]|uniref:Uncharacterized protein n=1 Tax=Dactylosporangium matsuzakiense TaxID=53360 RepID=A0A9W6KV03_9ACTN|nr:hypothetical protein GCM10017581_103490 [Dactylosporangium matsuzakiense]
MRAALQHPVAGLECGLQCGAGGPLGPLGREPAGLRAVAGPGGMFAGQVGPFVG